MVLFEQSLLDFKDKNRFFSCGIISYALLLVSAIPILKNFIIFHPWMCFSKRREYQLKKNTFRRSVSPSDIYSENSTAPSER